MSWLSRLGNVFRASRIDAELDEELRFHRSARVDDLIARGLTRAEAEAEVLRRFGNPLLLREKSRDIKLIPWLESILQDIRFGARSLRKNAIVTTAAVASLSLTIGACVAAFALLDALILRPLPVHEPARLVYVTFSDETFSDGPAGATERDTFSYPLFERFRDAARAQGDLFAVGYQSIRRMVFADSRGQEEKVRAQLISGNGFATLGLKPALGRLLTAADDVTAGGHPVAVLSHAFWMRRFGGDPSVIGRSFTHDAHAFEIVGVLEPPFVGVEPGLLIDLWIPAMMQSADVLANPGHHWLRIFGRLKPGVRPDQARAVLQATFTNFRQDRARLVFRADEPRDRIARYAATPLNLQSGAKGLSALRRSFERPLWILAAVVGLVLLIAGSNVANLFLARAAAREHEMSLRLSIGAGRRRLIQQVLIESGLVSTVACVFALLFAYAAAPAVVRMLAPAEYPAYLDLRVSWRLFAFLGVVGLLTTILFGLAPALRASGVAPIGALKAAGERAVSRAPLLRPLVALQAGFSLAVLFIGGLLLLSFGKLTNIDLGFAKSGVLLLELEAREIKDLEQARFTAARLVDHIRRVPGVEAASLSGFALFGGSGWTNNIRIPGQPPEAFEPHYLAVSPGFFETMRIPLLEGRTIAARDAEPENPTAVVVNEAFARRYFGGRAVGRTFGRVDKVLAEQRIVGMVGNAKYRDLRAPAPPTVYVPLRGLGTLHVRTAGDPLRLTSTLRREVHAIHPALRVTDVHLQSTLIDNNLLRERVLALLSGFFALVGLLLAAIGLHGVLSYSVVRRTREIGIRIALGAERRTIVRSVLSDAGAMVVLGAIGGLATGLYLARFIRTLLYEVEPLDFWTIALPLAALLAAATLAALPPARRATRVDPIVALRYE
jgi:predicted permease